MNKGVLDRLAEAGADGDREMAAYARAGRDGVAVAAIDFRELERLSEAV